MSMHIFLGAPTPNDLKRSRETPLCSSTPSWLTSKLDLVPILPPQLPVSQCELSETEWQHASQRISLIYKDALLEEGNDDDIFGLITGSQDGSLDEISWFSTQYEERDIGQSQEKSNKDETTDLSLEQTGESYDTAGESLLMVLPTFRIPLHTLSTLAALGKIRSSQPVKINALCVVLELEGPDPIFLKRGKDAGKQVLLLKLIVGEAEGGVAKVTIWDELAAEWGDVLCKGDVVYLKNILFQSKQSDQTTTFSASKAAGSEATICYRTLYHQPSDVQWRPDLQLGRHDPGVWAVSKQVEWVSKVALS